MPEVLEIVDTGRKTIGLIVTGRYETDGTTGLQDRPLGFASVHAVLADEVPQRIALYESRYIGWAMKHFYTR